MQTLRKPTNNSNRSEFHYIIQNFRLWNSEALQYKNDGFLKNIQTSIRRRIASNWHTSNDKIGVHVSSLSKSYKKYLTRINIRNSKRSALTRSILRKNNSWFLSSLRANLCDTLRIGPLGSNGFPLDREDYFGIARIILRRGELFLNHGYICWVILWSTRSRIHSLDYSVIGRIILTSGEWLVELSILW